MRDVKEFICFGEKDRRAVSVEIRDRLLQLHYFQPLCYKKKKAIAPSVFLFVCLDRGVFVGTVEQIMCVCMRLRVCGRCCSVIDGDSLQIYQSQKTVA